MTVPSTTRIATYNCDNALTAFAFTYPFFASGDLVVTLITVADGTELVLVEGAGAGKYEVSTTENSYRDGGTVTVGTTYSNLYQIQIERVVDITQDTEYDKYDAFPALTTEDALDRLTMIDQQLEDEQEADDARCIHVDTASEIDGIDEKTSSVSGDMFVMEDSEDSFAKKKVDADNMPNSNTVAVGLNTAKDTNVSTNLSAGTRTATTIDVNSSDGTNATLVEADTTNAGILGSDKWDEVVASTAHISANGSSHTYIDQSVVSGASPAFTSPALTTPVLNTSISGTAFLDEDAMGSDSAVKVASQQSIKKYVDDQVSAAGNWTVDGDEIYWEKDANKSLAAGTVRIGYNGTSSDQAVFAHYDNFNVTDYALKQSGSTYLNTPTGNNIFFSINNSVIGRWGSNGDLYTVAPTDYFATSTKSGWSSPSGTIFYRKLGKQVSVWFSISGTSNLINTSFTLPYANTSSFEMQAATGRFTDNSLPISTACRVRILTSSSTVLCYTNMSSSSWTATGSKAVFGSFVYYTD